MGTNFKTAAVIMINKYSERTLPGELNGALLEFIFCHSAGFELKREMKIIIRKYVGLLPFYF